MIKRTGIHSGRVLLNRPLPRSDSTARVAKFVHDMLSCSSLLGGLLLHSLLVALTPASAAGAADPLRVNPPLVPFKLEPLRCECSDPSVV